MASRPRYPTDHEPELTVRSAVHRFDDFAEVVGVKKPGGGGCWCMSYRDARLSNTERPEYMRAECATEPGPGVLAYVDGEVAGWCSVAPRSSYRRLMNSRTIPFVDERDAWVAVCFVVRAGFRGHGVMHTLLDGAVEHAAAHGAEVIEGYPVDLDPAAGAPSGSGRGAEPGHGDADGGVSGRVDVISGYVGTVRLFEQHGFHRVAETTAHSGGRTRWILRRELG
ncbi:GNAT family N-acetyltransferase [Schumannella soli]|uniref:GNAT family N-acetyltransferase n=1 Tax=Schumannella soli TaxID=2590779 RepID=A0A506XU41_9MICO|nr:GNAT family N-acetyltransferase [Schumannella soli]TPW76231.1 GNAT family N-acetyltransferase [Schumannella soli]